MDWTEKTLIRLKRQYEKDEIISAFIKKARELEIENGQLKSYVDELKYDKEQLIKESFENSKKNGGEVWFKNYNELLKNNNSKFNKKINALQFKLSKQFNHGKMLETKLSAYRQKLSETLSFDDFKSFVREIKNVEPLNKQEINITKINKSTLK